MYFAQRGYWPSRPIIHCRCVLRYSVHYCRSKEESLFLSNASRFFTWPQKTNLLAASTSTQPSHFPRIGSRHSIIIVVITKDLIWYFRQKHSGFIESKDWRNFLNSCCTNGNNIMVPLPPHLFSNSSSRNFATRR